VLLTALKNMKVNGKDYPIYYGKPKMFQTTNKYRLIKYVKPQCSIWGWIKTLVPSEPLKIAGKWMFIPLKMYL